MVRSLSAVTTPFTTVMHGTLSPAHPALPLIPLSAVFDADVTIPLVMVKHGMDPAVHPNVPLTVDGVRLVVEPQPQFALEGIITKRARPD